MRSTPMRAADSRKTGAKVEITVNAAGMQSMSPPASPSKQDKVCPDSKITEHADLMLCPSVAGAGLRQQHNQLLLYACSLPYYSGC